MTSPEPTTTELAAQIPAALLHEPRGILLGLDFDGTLSHVVDDPMQAFAHPDSVAAVGRLGRVLGKVAIVTGRPVDQALTLSGFRGLAGLESLAIRGQYGAERWDAETDEVTRPERSLAVERLAEQLPSWLAGRGAADARVEDKGLAVAVHTRGLEPGVLDDLRAPLAELAAEHGLAVEPGRQVLELRSHAGDKGDAVRDLVEATGLRRVVYAGDDLGDLPAFEEVGRMRSGGDDGYLVCSASAEQDALVALSDLVLDGPDAVAAWLTAWADALGA